MRIATNIAALNASRMLSLTDASRADAVRRLSSGQRITSAADDAAGLAISEGLRSQVRGMAQAVDNVQNGINVVRTAEGALHEVSAVLRRMRDLAVQAASTGVMGADPTRAVGVEFEQLKAEIERVARTTAFNGMALLDGSYDGILQIGSAPGDTLRIAIGSVGEGMGAVDLGLSAVHITRYRSEETGEWGNGWVGVQAGRVPAVSDDEGTPAPGTLTLHGGDFVTGEYEAGFRALTGWVRYGDDHLDLSAVDYSGADTAQEHLDALNAAAQAALGPGFTPFTATATGLTTTGATPGPGSTAEDAVAVSPRYYVHGGMAAVIRAVDAAIGRVSEVRADLGAYENRLEHTVRRLGVSIENGTAAESRIRDADMAAEMVLLSRSQVLAEAGTAMLAQASKARENVLRLLGSP
ncbi:flagellin N-terminal helical domain-containing protein [Blastococcus haudaquaticus]|uniref:Flagellin n=1 Tax=Blastococcus haudaquaticus TaxID=1938745 RepID=A0A286GQ32_9ACTN|nr:flagellin [Blastococcus haudaquaticus]SOD97661.1 flagellin [Blastococcus haudaquaticus]